MANRSEWIERVRSWRASGLTAKAYCAEHDLAVASLQQWSSKLLRGESHVSPEPVKLARVVRAPRITADAEVVVEVGRMRVRFAGQDVVVRVLDALSRMATS